MKYFAKLRENGERRREIEENKEYEKLYGIMPGTVFEDKEGEKLLCCIRVPGETHEFTITYYVKLDKNMFPIEDENHGYDYKYVFFSPHKPIGKKVGYFTPTMWKRHIEAAREVAV